MDLLQLKYFLAVAKHGNITHAANELYIAQPSLSRTIANLEEELGHKLFDRKGKRIYLNENGEIFAKRIRRIFSDIDMAKHELDDLSGRKQRRLIIGSTIARLMPKLLSGFLSEHGSVQFNLIQVTNHDSIKNRLLNGEIDLSISILPVENDGCECVRLAYDPLVLIIPESHRLAGEDKISIASLAEEPLVYHSGETGLRVICDSFFEEIGVTPYIAFECTTPDVICELVRCGFGYALIPSSWLETVNTAGLCVHNVSDAVCGRHFWIGWLKDRYMSAAVREFIRYSSEYFARIEESL